MSKILLTGANGQVGWELQRTLSGQSQLIALTREQLDLASAEHIRAVVREHQPAVIINPAAYTAVDKAETEVERAMAVNAHAPAILAEEAARCGAVLVHYSTDYVFDGKQAAPYVETDNPNPQSIYGKSKLAGEEAIRASGCRHLILRTSWVYGGHGGNFVKTMLRLAHERDELRIVADQFGAPTWARMIAGATEQVLRHWQARGLDSALSGVYHLTAAGRTNWHQYAEEIIRLARQYDEQLQNRDIRVTPIATHEYPVPASRPANSSLCTDKIQQVFGLELPSWQTELAHCVAEMYSTH